MREENDNMNDKMRLCGTEPSLASRDRYVAVLDILGFSNLVKTNKLQEVVSIYEQFLNNIVWQSKTLVEIWGEEIEYRLFSDAIVAFSKGTLCTDFTNMRRFCQTLIGFSFLRGLLLRGAITKGELWINGNIVLGSPVVRAYELEKAQEWVGCVIEDHCIKGLQSEEKGHIEGKEIILYEVPMKKGKVDKQWALNWTWPLVQMTTEAAILDCLNRLLGQNNDVDWCVKRKQDNTLKFVKSAIHLKSDPLNG
jgi:hypothetical protein